VSAGYLPDGPTEQLLRPTQVAQIMGVGRTTVYELMSSGELPVVRVR
jgi:excisionase family DNA binding protein